jgi:ABC-type Fe3+/spermidine/putrescine transport system ATPase subunit
MMLTAQNIQAGYDGQPVLQNVDLAVEHGEILCLLGPSGCGKTTLLRVIAGLEDAGGGIIRLDGDSIEAVPVHARGFGLMFQDFALFPHLSVGDNVTFGLKMARIPAEERRERLQAMLDLVGLSGFAERDITQLSGGEKQRVALARSLAPQPRLLMLDEPLGSLDASLRERLVVDVRSIIKRVGLTAIYVTHDQQEAFAVADRIAVMNAGHIEQIAGAETLYRQPATPFVAQFMGLNNVLPADRVPGAPAGADQVLIHPDDIIPVADEQASLRGRVVERVFMGGRYRVRIALDDHHSLMFYVTDSDYTSAEWCAVTFDPARLITF